MKISGWRMPISGRRTERRWVLLNYFYFSLSRDILILRILRLRFPYFCTNFLSLFFFLSTNFSTNFTTRLETSEPTIARSTWRPVFDHRTRVPALNSIENENSDAGLIVNTQDNYNSRQEINKSRARRTHPVSLSFTPTPDQQDALLFVLLSVPFFLSLSSLLVPLLRD